ncbi:unnamed protein product [Durusdinium trenchii]|uniref:Cyclic nucleotide-binding domain-containing protein n=1 Tax=Durusdinium trenchii TaxID=1381693 RepID=A0ABP0LZ90_9DINO
MGSLLCKDCSNAPEDFQAHTPEQKSVLAKRAKHKAQRMFRTKPAVVDSEPGRFLQQVIKEGDPGDAFFIIRSGDAAVVVGGRQVALLKEGDYFGENALLRDEPRSATILAKSELFTFRQSCVPLDDKKIALLIDAAWKENVPMGKELIQEGAKRLHTASRLSL